MTPIEAQDDEDYEECQAFEGYTQAVDGLYSKQGQWGALNATDLPFVPDVFPLTKQWSYQDWTQPFQSQNKHLEIPSTIQWWGVFKLQVFSNCSHDCFEYSFLPPRAQQRGPRLLFLFVTPLTARSEAFVFVRDPFDMIVRY